MIKNWKLDDTNLKIGKNDGQVCVELNTFDADFDQVMRKFRMGNFQCTYFVLCDKKLSK
ncbi:Uncharacterized protein BM_BM18056 [Brugia malayi]|uniref:Uncharacterized protein n=1 Tax=Brugia malayi TaxID=6279 RepID=A0A4E9F152_BRUMA|nr:Uncharacterized protein BM_BM18056 [Brugia malayi]VIO89482.1 Uncharacterized protein BM_BM18056 [Brugia malayi]